MPQFEKMRHKWIAHYEVERDPLTQEFRDIEWSTLTDLYPDLMHQVRDWFSGAAAYFGWMREAKRENTR